MPDIQLTETRNQISKRRLGTVAKYLNERYGLDLAQILTAGPRQGLADETPYLYIARGHTPADVVVAVSVDHSGDSPVYVIEAYTATAWFDLGDPFMVLKREISIEVAIVVTHYIPFTPTT